MINPALYRDKAVQVDILTEPPAVAFRDQYDENMRERTHVRHGTTQTNIILGSQPRDDPPPNPQNEQEESSYEEIQNHPSQEIIVITDSQ